MSGAKENEVSTATEPEEEVAGYGEYLATVRLYVSASGPDGDLDKAAQAAADYLANNLARNINAHGCDVEFEVEGE